MQIAPELPAVKADTEIDNEPVKQPKPSRAPYLFFVVMALFLVVMGSRFTRLMDFETDRDELLSIQRAQATTFEDLLLWLPNDWPPLYYMALAGWKELVGLHPAYLRLGSALISLFGFALMYRVGRRLGGEWAGILSMLAYAALSYGIVIDLKLRGYVIVHALIPALLWLTLLYFEQPNWRRAIPLALTIAVMFYSTYISALMFMVIGVFSLVMVGRRIWRWWLPGMMASVLVLPEALRKFSVAADVASASQPGQPYLDALVDMFRGWTGFYAEIWVALAVVAALVFAIQRRWRWLIVFAFWIVGLPSLMYLLLDPRFTFTQRYSFWAMGGIALLVGWGLSKLPRLLAGASGGVLVVVMLLPVPLPDYFTFDYTQTFHWLAQHVRAGDVFIIDENCRCPQPREWNYYVRLYFPSQSLQLVDEPGDYRRVWYVSSEIEDDTPLFEATRAGRVAQMYVGPTDFLFQLYEAPPDPEGIPFANGMRFHGMDFIDPMDDTPWFGALEMMENQTIRLRLWWSADRPIDLDYSVATYVSRVRVPMEQFDGPPQLIDPRQPRETSQWLTDKIYIEEREMRLPQVGTRNLNFNVFLKVYQWWDGVAVDSAATDEDGLLLLAPIRVKPS